MDRVVSNGGDPDDTRVLRSHGLGRALEVNADELWAALAETHAEVVQASGATRFRVRADGSYERTEP
jgi:hypothetical protein